MHDKSVSAMSAMARAAAQKAGHNPALADAFIRKEAELKIGDAVIDGPESLLTLSAPEAMRQFDGKPLLAEGIASSLEEMLRMASLNGVVRQVEPTGFERLASYLTVLAPLLLVGGILGAYIEIKTPGFSLPGIFSVICFSLFFAGSYARVWQAGKRWSFSCSGWVCWFPSCSCIPARFFQALSGSS